MPGNRREERVAKMKRNAAGAYLRQTRMRLGMTIREVELASKNIALAEQNPDIMISHARLIQIESGESTPSIYKLYSLSAIYGLKMTNLLALYVDIATIPKHHLNAGVPSTH